MPTAEQFQSVFTQLKQILQPFAPQLVVQADTPENYYLDTPHIAHLQRSIFFGAVQIKKNYVSYHLMSVYIFPALLDQISPQLKKRMQGKSCFNFTRIDQAMLDELAHLTAQGFEVYRREYGI
ncbi:MAG TPA: hypothetical protein VFZ66_13885 [Herpetosiphonaceae bacterium]